MMNQKNHSASQAGYTLIELLLYVAILGGLLMSVTYFFGMTVDARVKNQSIAEVDDQGTAVMDYLTQTVRNASAIGAPFVGTSASSLSLGVPTAALSPTVFNFSGVTSTLLGYNVDGTSDDTDDNNIINSSKFVASATGTVSAVYVRIGATVSASPNNKGQVAIYSGATPTTLLAASADTVLTPNEWNTFSLPSVSVTSGQTYWIAFNANGLTTTSNTMRIHPGTAGQSRFIAQTYGAWPASFAGTNEAFEYSTWTTIEAGSSSGTLQVKEGTATAVPLLNNDVQISSLTFKNLTRSGTNGVVQISFTLSRLNPSNRNEYDYQRTFTGTAEIRW